MATSPDYVRWASNSRALTDAVFDALREAVLVVDTRSKHLPIVIANATARRCFLGDPDAGSLIDCSLYSLLGSSTDTAVEAALGSLSAGNDSSRRLLTWRFPRGKMAISTEFKRVASAPQPHTVMLSFADPSEESLVEPGVLSAIEQLPLDLLILDKELTVTYANVGAARTAGSSPRQMLGYSALTLVPTSVVPREALVGALQGIHFRDEAVPVKTPGEPTRWFEIEVQPLETDAAIVGVAVLSTELTESHVEARSVEGSRLMALTAHARDIINIAGIDGKWLYVSGGVTNVLGYTPEERRSNEIFEFVHPDDLDELKSKYAALVAGTAGAFTHQYRVRHRDGSYRWLEASWVSALDNPLIKGIVLNARDITERKEAEYTLAQREEVFRLATDAVSGAQIALENSTDWLKLSMNMAHMHPWRWNRATDTLEFAMDDPTENLQRAFPALKKLLSRVHPEDRPTVRRAIDRAFAQHVEVQEEFRLKSPNGRYRAYAAVARPLFDAANQPSGLVGVTQDITQRHEAEARLRRSEELLRTTTTNTADTLLLLDTNLRIRFINRDARDMSAGDIVGQDISVLLPEAARNPLIAKLRRVLKGAAPATYEFEYPSAAGTEYFESRAVLVREDGIGTGISITVRNITERRRLEREILDVAARERQTIGRDLHDGLGQELTGVALMLRGLATRIKKECPDVIVQVNEVVALVNQSIDTARALARGLLPVNKERGGLSNALRALIDRSRALYGFEARFQAEVSEDVPLNETTASHLFRIAQEALTNTARHSRATTVGLYLTVTKTRFSLRITDDGVGIGDAARAGTGMGLRIMKYRAGMIGAKIEIGPNDPHGTVVRVTGERSTATNSLESVQALQAL